MLSQRWIIFRRPTVSWRQQGRSVTFMLAERRPSCQHETTQTQILATSCNTSLLRIWPTKQCNQIRKSTTLLHQIFQRLKNVPQWSPPVTNELQSVGTFHFGAVNAIREQDQTLALLCRSREPWKRLFFRLLLPFDRRYTESRFCQLSVAVFSSSSLLPESLVCSRTAVGHTFCLAVISCKNV